MLQSFPIELLLLEVAGFSATTIFFYYFFLGVPLIFRIGLKIITAKLFPGARGLQGSGEDATQWPSFLSRVRTRLSLGGLPHLALLSTKRCHLHSLARKEM